MQSRKSQKNAVTISQKAFTTATKQISHDSQKSVTTVDSAVDRGFNRRAGGMIVDRGVSQPNGTNNTTTSV